MNIEYLHEFIVMSKRLNFHEAASELNMSVSALSKHISVLESYFGTKLFTRDTHRVNLTESGVFLLDCAEVMWGMLEQSKAAIRDRFSTKNLIRCGGVLDNAGLYPIVASAEKAMREEWPDAAVRIEASQQISLEVLVDQLMAERIDCAVVYDAQGRCASYPDIELASISPIPLEVVFPSAHRFATCKVITAEMLANEQLVQLMGPRYSSTWRRIEARLQKAGVPHKVKPVVAATPYDAITATSSLSDALFISPRRSTPSQTLRSSNLMAAPIDFNDLHLELDLLFLAQNRTPQLEAYIASLRQAFSAFYPEVPREGAGETS